MIDESIFDEKLCTEIFPGAGSSCLFPIETHITCDFPGESESPVRPLEPRMESSAI